MGQVTYSTQNSFIRNSSNQSITYSLRIKQLLKEQEYLTKRQHYHVGGNWNEQSWSDTLEDQGEIYIPPIFKDEYTTQIVLQPQKQSNYGLQNNSFCDQNYLSVYKGTDNEKKPIIINMRIKLLKHLRITIDQKFQVIFGENV